MRTLPTVIVSPSLMRLTPRLVRERVLPGRVALVGHVQRRAGARRQLAAAGQEVRVDVRLGDVRDAHAFGLRGLHDTDRRRGSDR